MANYRGVDRYFVLTSETDWNTFEQDESAATILYPIGIGDDGVAMAVDPGQNILETNVGHGIPFYINTGINSYTGTINCPITSGASGKALVEWGSKITSSNLDSYSLDIGGGESYERWTGVTVESMAMSTGSASGAQRLTGAFSLIGGNFDNSVTPDPYTEDVTKYSSGSGYLHSQAQLFLLGTSSGHVDTTVTDLTITVSNTLDVGNGTGTDPSYIQFCGRQVTLECTIEYDQSNFIDAFKASPPTSIELQAKYTDGSDSLTLSLETAAKVTAFTPVNSLGARATSNITFLATSPTNPAGSTATDFVVT